MNSWAIKPFFTHAIESLFHSKRWDFFLADLNAAISATTSAPDTSASGMDRNSEYWYKKKSTVAVVTMQALSAVIRMKRLVFVMLPKLGSL